MKQIMYETESVDYFSYCAHMLRKCILQGGTSESKSVIISLIFIRKYVRNIRFKIPCKLAASLLFETS